MLGFCLFCWFASWATCVYRDILPFSQHGEQAGFCGRTIPHEPQPHTSDALLGSGCSTRPPVHLKREAWSVHVLPLLSAHPDFTSPSSRGADAAAARLGGWIRIHPCVCTEKGMLLLPPRPLSRSASLINNYRQLKDLFIPKGLPFTFLRGSAQGDTMIIRLTRDPYFTMSL